MVIILLKTFFNIKFRVASAYHIKLKWSSLWKLTVELGIEASHMLELPTLTVLVDYPIELPCHLTCINEFLKTQSKILDHSALKHADCTLFNADESSGRARFLYLLEKQLLIHNRARVLTA